MKTLIQKSVTKIPGSNIKPGIFVTDFWIKVSIVKCHFAVGSDVLLSHENDQWFHLVQELSCDKVWISSCVVDKATESSACPVGIQPI